MDRKAMEKFWWILGGGLLVLVFILLGLWLINGGWEILKSMFKIAESANSTNVSLPT